jgi:3-hydroxybutyryl-CoA dehydratase
MTALHGYSFTMTQEAIDAWAALSGDFNPLHVEPAYAAASPFGGTIAHGHIAAAILSHLCLHRFGDAWTSGGELDGLRFKAPVRPGCTYRILTIDAGPSCVVEVVADDGTVCITGTIRLPDRHGVDDREG